jgi:hypothetical protein
MQIVFGLPFRSVRERGVSSKRVTLKNCRSWRLVIRERELEVEQRSIGCLQIAGEDIGQPFALHARVFRGFETLDVFALPRLAVFSRFVEMVIIRQRRLIDVLGALPVH